MRSANLFFFTQPQEMFEAWYQAQQNIPFEEKEEPFFVEFQQQPVSYGSVIDTAYQDSLYWKEQHLYGSSRLGIAKPELEVTNYTPSNFLLLTSNFKNYELTNHLGNVLATIKDEKQQKDDNNDGIVDYYEPIVITAQDYYPFGMVMPNRSFSLGGSNYRFGFNNKENDNEVMGEGNFQDYGFRMYNTRLGRFISVDPLTKEYPWYTPYQFAGNKPIAFIDRDGLEEARPDEIKAALLHPVHAYIVNKNADKAREAAANSGLPDPRDGQFDAFRHAYWNALNARALGEKSSALFPTLHETGSEANNPSSPEYDPKAIEMDLFNNEVGRKIGAANPNATDEELQQKVMDALNAGELKVIKIEEVPTPTGTERVPTNTSGQPVTDNKDKVIQPSATPSASSGATTPQKSKMGYDKKSKEYTNPNPLPPK